MTGSLLVPLMISVPANQVMINIVTEPKNSLIGEASSLLRLIPMAYFCQLSVVLLNLFFRILSALNILMTFEDFKVSSTKENKFPSSSCAAVACLFKLFPTQPINKPINGKTKRENNVNCGERKNSVIKEAMIIKGEFSTSTKLPIIPFSTPPMSLEIRDIISPFLCSVKKDTGNFKNLSYIIVRRSFVIPTR